MIRFIKRLFGESHSDQPVSNSSIGSTPKPEKNSSGRPPQPVQQAAAQAPASPYAPAPDLGPCMDIPLRVIAQRLPTSLRSRLTRSPAEGDCLHLPLSSVLEQLPRGAVRIPFRELRQRSTPGFFSLAHDADDSVVDVPLAEVLCRLPASHLRRRPEQRTVPVPQNIPAVFGSRAAGSEAVTALRTTEAPTVTAPSATDQLSTTRVLSTPIHSVTTPAMQPTAPGASQVLEAFPAFAPSRSETAPMPALRVTLPPPPPAAPASAPAATPANSSAASAEALEPVKVPLVALARNWPEQLRREIMATNLSAAINIPYGELEAAMKRGKAVFSWKQLRIWMTPKSSNPLSEHDSVSLELPLPILTPLFLGRRSGDRQPMKAAHAPDMPDIFTSKKASEPVPEPNLMPVAVPTAGPSATAPSVPKLAMADATVRLPESTRGTATSSAPLDRLTMARSSALPTQLVQKACHLSGVSGALLATSDGLVIASQVAPGMSAESIAAFLPEIFSRLNQYTRELKLGDPTQIELLAGNIPLQIFKAANTFYAVFGKAAEPLPKLQLTALATQLSQPQH